MHSFTPWNRLIPFLPFLVAAATFPVRAFDPGAFPNSPGDAPKRGAIRVVACDEKVRSTKRGVCMNDMSQEDFAALSPGVSWYYNWHYETQYQGISGSMQFIPMMWGNRPEALRGLDHYLSSLPQKPPVILAINEPNLKGQAFITPQQTAELYRQTKDVADRYHIPLVGPNMALGSATGDSISAEDPIENKRITYNFMVPFLKATLYYLKNSNTDVPALAFHSYGSAGEIKWAVDMMHKTFNCPIWVTEYAQWKNPDSEAARKYLIEATDFLERTPYVAGYAWFKERVKGNPNISLLESDSGKLSPLGETYVSLPAHDDTVYYRIPGRLQAEDYVTVDGADIRPTVDTNGEYQMASNSSAATLDYNIQVDAPGMYTLAFRVAGSAGKLDILEGASLMGTAETPAGNDWRTVTAAVRMPAGPQKLRIRYSTSGLCLNWIEFARQ